MIALRLARAGYGSGDPMQIMAWPADIVMAADHYENFIQKYERRFLELNPPGEQ